MNLQSKMQMVKRNIDLMIRIFQLNNLQTMMMQGRGEFIVGQTPFRRVFHKLLLHIV